MYRTYCTGSIPSVRIKSTIRAIMDISDIRRRDSRHHSFTVFLPWCYVKLSVGERLCLCVIVLADTNIYFVFDETASRASSCELLMIILP